jgi:hypothetical protein
MSDNNDDSNHIDDINQYDDGDNYDDDEDDNNYDDDLSDLSDHDDSPINTTNNNNINDDDNDIDGYDNNESISVYTRLRHIVSKNQFIIHSLQYLSAASILLIPSTYQYYEAAAETCHTLSNLISYINTTVLSNNTQRYSRIEYILRQITRFIAQIEVLTDRVASICYDEAGRTLAIVIIESTKALCRLLILVNRSNISMLLHWGKDDHNGQSATIDLENYINWYKLAVLSYRSRSSQQYQRQEGPIINNESHYVNVNNINTTTNIKQTNYIGTIFVIRNVIIITLLIV